MISLETRTGAASLEWWKDEKVEMRSPKISLFPELWLRKKRDGCDYIHGFLCNRESFLTEGLVKLVGYGLFRSSLNLSLLCPFFHCLRLIPWTKGSSWVSQVFLWVNRSDSHIPWASACCQIIRAHNYGKVPWNGHHCSVCAPHSPDPMQPVSHCYLLARSVSLAHFLCPIIHINSHFVPTGLRPNRFPSQTTLGLRVLVDTANILSICIFLLVKEPPSFTGA